MKLFLPLLCCLCLIQGYSQDSNESKTVENEYKRTFLIEPYLMFPNMSGVNQIKNLPEVEVDASPGDIFGQLKFGGMLYFETSKKGWTISADFIYMHLAMGIEERLLVQSGEIDVKETLFEVAGLKKVSNWLDVGIGGRIVSIKEGVTINLKGINPQTVSGKLTETWFDPILIVRSQGSLAERWFYQFRGDLGGFGLGSDFTWQIQANVGYQLSEKFHLSLGYRNIFINYENGSGSNYFKYDMSTFGPNLRIGYGF